MEAYFAKQYRFCLLSPLRPESMAGMIAPLLLLAATLQTPPSVPPEDPKGYWLFHACKGTIRWWDAPISNKPNEEIENFDNCTSYINGFIEASLSLGDCLLPEGSNGTIVRKYVAYMERNPKLLDEDRVVGLRAALRNRYPCPPR